MKLALLAGLLCVALLAGAATANASPAHRDAVLGATDEWIGSVLHVPVPDRVDSPGLPGELSAGEGGVLCETPTEAHYDPPLLKAMAGRGNEYFLESWAIALHEHLHLIGHGCAYDWMSEREDFLDEEWAYYEEGFVDAERLDLYPAFMWRMFGMREVSYAMEDYVENIAVVRALSRYATGSRTWRDRAARLWRRAGLIADWPARQRMIAEANAVRG